LFKDGYMDDRGLLDLTISLLPGLTPVDRICLLEAFGREEDLIRQSKRDIDELLGRELKYFWDIDEVRIRAQREEALCRARSIRWVSWISADYPPLLREIYDPPAVIFYRGRLPNPEKPLLGMVGTRHPSPEAASQAYAVAFGVGQAGISVVSGLAFGIDAMSHRGNLLSAAPGYAVLGSGVDEIFPSANKPLAKRILESGGAVISEYPCGTLPGKWNFPARNRIISALSRSVLVVEAPKKSGALITAAFALEQGKDLWVASSGIQEEQRGSFFDKRGTVRLAADGAEIIYSACDILGKWNVNITRNDYSASVSVGNAGGRDLAASLANYLEIEI
jgi:DNA processing protein